MIWLSPRVNYIRPEQEKPSSIPFQSGYLMSGISKEPLVFEFLAKN